MKLYVDEAGHEHVRGRVPLVVAEVARVEVPAAIWGKHRLGELAVDHARVLVDDFEADYFGTAEEVPRLVVVALRSERLDGAARLCSLHGLRAYDAVQLSCALAARQADPACATVAAFDAQLRAAAVVEGFSLLPAAV